MAGTGQVQVSIPIGIWEMSEAIAFRIAGIVNEYANTRMEVWREESRIAGKGYEWVEGDGASIEVMGEAPVEPVRDWLRANDFRQVDIISNTIEEGDEYKVWEVGEKWGKVVYTGDYVTILIQVDLAYEVDSRGVERLGSVSVYPIMNTWAPSPGFAGAS